MFGSVVKSNAPVVRPHGHQDVTLKIDLAQLCRVGEEPGTLDLHVNFAPSYQMVVRA
jgi:hypothetical protein